MTRWLTRHIAAVGEHVHADALGPLGKGTAHSCNNLIVAGVDAPITAQAKAWKGLLLSVRGSCRLLPRLQA